MKPQTKLLHDMNNKVDGAQLGHEFCEDWKIE